MKTSKFTGKQVVKVLEEGQSNEGTVKELCRKHGIHKQIITAARRSTAD